MFLRSAGDALDGAEIDWVRQLARHAQEVRQIHDSNTQTVDARNGSDLLDVLHTNFGLDLQHQKATLIGLFELFARGSPAIVVVRRSEHRAAPSRRRISGPGDDVARLLSRLDHGDHHPERAYV